MTAPKLIESLELFIRVNPEVFALLYEQRVVILHSATKQDCRFFFINWRICFVSVLLFYSF